jgi:hypothetical protein
MSFLDILYDRERKYVHSNDKRRKKIIKLILEAHNMFRKSDYSIGKKRETNVELLHLAIMYADIYLENELKTNTEVNSLEIKKYNIHIIAAGCYSIAFKYEMDEYETDFINYLYDGCLKIIWNIKTLLTEVLEFEWILLGTLEWKANLVTPIAFINEYADELGLEHKDAAKFSLKMIILDVCLIPSNWGICCLILANNEILEHFNVSEEDFQTIEFVNEKITKDWELFEKENPEICKIVNKL